MSEIIDFIKRFLKWFLIFILLIILLISGSIAFINYNERLVTMFALECEVYESPLDGLGTQVYPAPGPDYYLFKRMNKSDIPDSIYVGINNSWDQTYLQDQKIYRLADLYQVTPSAYYFENILYDRVIFIDRKTLEMNSQSKQGSMIEKSNCKKISEETFFENIEKQITQENEGNQI